MLKNFRKAFPIELPKVMQEKYANKSGGITEITQGHSKGITDSC